MSIRSLRVLMVEDDPLCVASMRLQLASTAHGPPTVLDDCATVAGAFRALAAARYDVVLLDVHLGEEDGLEALARLCAAAGGAPVVVHSVAGDVDVVVRAMRLGAFDYLQKGPSAPGALHRRLRAFAARSRASTDDGMVGDSAALRQLRAQLAVARRSNGNVLITGESGVGKELVARALAPEGAPFVALDAGTLDEALASATLFGHERGAFTGAERACAGAFERADGGVLFIDELANLPRTVQAKLLRVVQEREVMRVGGKASKPVQLRMVCATNADLAQAVAQGSFRADLLARLEVFCLQVPPLRARREDVPALFAHFLRRAGNPSPRWDAAVDRVLSRCPFAGNVRQLANAAQVAAASAGRGEPLRLVHLPTSLHAWGAPDAANVGGAAGAEGGAGAIDASEAALGLTDAPSAARPEAQAQAFTADFHGQVRAFERRTLLRSFAEFRGNISAMARALKMDRSTLYAKLRLYAIYAPRTCAPTWGRA